MQTASNFSVKLKHDKGFVRIKVKARDKESAAKMACTMESCPPCAVISVRQLTCSKWFNKTEKDLTDRINPIQHHTHLKTSHL